MKLNDIGNLTIDSLKLFLQIYNYPNHKTTIHGSANGIRIANLAKLGLIIRFGKVKNKQIWKVYDISQEEINFIKKIVYE